MAESFYLFMNTFLMELSPIIFTEDSRTPLISGLEAVDITRSVRDINLSTMAVNKILNQALNELVDPFLGFDKDIVVREMVTSVAELAFRCLQYEREMRPTMEEVVEELRGIERENYGAGKGEIEYQGR
ncbi:hypothetical protein OIU76_029610 [Salix suchowensis]|nr:hypothetical protein OIU76_029610 [Salix suchowensis]